MPQLLPINPKDIIDGMSVDALCETADEYYGHVTDPTSLISKPFANLFEAPELLSRMGLLLSGLQLAKGSHVLDFGSGPCWLSRILNQLGCATVSTDASSLALEMGRRLFTLQPVLGGSIAPPEFLHFDGRHISIPDTSVDRIVCFDAFHHVPNQREVLAEFYRVLKDGGIAGFSEPGRNHSQAPQSQYEMANYRVLENDIVIEDITQLAEEIGFTSMYLKPLIEPNVIVTRDEYSQILRDRVFPDRLITSSLNAMASGTVFFFVKGRLQRDSRSPTGLQHRILVAPKEFQVARGGLAIAEVSIVNTGEALWLADTPNGLGAVKIGIHLYSANQQLINLDYHRSNLPKDIEPGEKISVQIEISSPPEQGDYLLCFDLVSEGVCWFQTIGSQPEFARLTAS